MTQQTKAGALVYTKVDSAAWGLIALIPFGWLLIWANINSRRSEVEKGLRDKYSAVTSIDNYIAGTISLIVVVTLITLAAGYALIPNLIAIAVLLSSAYRNKKRIENFTSIGEAILEDEETEELEAYSAKAKYLKARLEAIDKDSDDYEFAISSIRNDINKFFNEYKDAEFPDGGKYKIYELRAEYYFITGNKLQAKKYIEQASEIRQEEKNREKLADLYEEDYDEI